MLKFLLFSLLFALVCCHPGTVFLDDFAGSTDDLKLTAALAAVQTYSQIPAIMLSNRLYTFSQTRTAFSGLKIVGPPGGYYNSELSSGKLSSCRVRLTVGTGMNSWFVGTGNIYNVYIANIGFISSNGNSQFWHHPLGSGTTYASAFDTLGFFGLRHVFGNATHKAALTQVNFIGQWSVLPGHASTQFFLGGSDNEFWTSGYLNIDSGNSFPSVGQYLLRFSDLGKTNVGAIYVTAKNGWAGVLVEGGSSYGVALTMTGARLEGRNNGEPSNGALLVQKGGKAIYRNMWVAYGMANPSANQHSPTDAALIMHLGGEALWDGTTTDRATGVAETVPLFYVQTGTKIRIFNTFTGTRGGAWTGLPRVQKISSAVVTADDTVTIV